MSHEKCKPAGPVYLTPRFALQRLGTEFGRACYEDVWIDYALRRARMALAEQKPDPCYDGSVGSWPGAPLVVIPDVRFVNEARKIREAGGQVWRVSRPKGRLSIPVPITRDMDISFTLGGTDDHASEREQFSAGMDEYVSSEIVNEPTMGLPQLRALVATLLAPGAPRAPMAPPKES